MKGLCDLPAGTKIIADLRQDKELDLQEGSVHRFLHIAQDNFYRDLTPEEQAHSFNFDHPAVSSIPYLSHAKLHVTWLCFQCHGLMPFACPSFDISAKLQPLGM